MTKAEEVVERSMALVTALRARRERELEQRAKWQRRVELSRPLPPYVRPVQLSLIV